MGAHERSVLGRELSATELRDQLLAQRTGEPFLFLADGGAEGALLIVPLRGERMVVGRAPGTDLRIAWDGRVSAIHAQLERRGPGWVIEDDGLSRNGTFVEGERLHGQRALRDGMTLRVGETAIGFRSPEAGGGTAATVVVPTLDAPQVSEAQRRVLVALCRPLAASERATPATNEQVAEELHLSLAAVKSHLRVLFERFGLEALPQNEKRARLAERAITQGVVRSSELA